jgi:selenocysteine lyase/cysteine desulfurase
LPGRPRTPTVSFTIDRVAPADAAKALVREGVFVSNGNFYATTVAEHLGNKEGFVRAGCACYTTESEIDRLIEGVQAMAK